MASEHNERGGLVRRLLFGGEPTGSRLADIGLLALRLWAGVIIAGAGMDKFPTTNWFAAQVEGMGFPMPRVFAFAAVFSEWAGGWLLVVGLLSRPAALFVAFTMGVAAFAFHSDVPFLAPHVARLLFLIFFALLFTGPGRISLDYLVRKAPRLQSAGAGVVVAMLAYGLYLEVQHPPAQPTAATSLEEVEAVSLAGSFNAWDITATPMEPGDSGVWSASVTIDEPGPFEFKFATDGGWSLNLGAAEDATSGMPLDAVGRLSTDGEPGNIAGYAPRAGEYEFTLEPTTGRYTVTEAEAGESRP